MAQIGVADEVWIATALLHREQPWRDSFRIAEIVERARRERVHVPPRPGVQTYASVNAVANRPATTVKIRMLFAPERGVRRLFRPGDAFDPTRTGRTIPERESLPARYVDLLDWYRDIFSSGITAQSQSDASPIGGQQNALPAVIEAIPRPPFGAKFRTLQGSTESNESVGQARVIGQPDNPRRSSFANLKGLAHSIWSRLTSSEPTEDSLQSVPATSVLIVTSCTSRKRWSPRNQLTRSDFTDADHLAGREAELVSYRLPARDMYTGDQHLQVIEALKLMHGHGVSADLVVVSAGYGVITGDTPIVPYNISFTTMTATDAAAWADRLNIPSDIRQVVQPYAVVIFLLGDQYLTAIRPPLEAAVGQRLIFFARPAKTRLSAPGVLHISAGDERRRQFGAASNIELKGKMLRALAYELVDDPERTLRVLLLGSASDVDGALHSGRRRWLSREVPSGAGNDRHSRPRPELEPPPSSARMPQGGSATLSPRPNGLAMHQHSNPVAPSPRLSETGPLPTAEVTSTPLPRSSGIDGAGVAGTRSIAYRLSAAFSRGELDLSGRQNPPPPGWSGMPECYVVERLRAAGFDLVQTRLFLTLVAALDRARDADLLWRAAGRMVTAHPWIIQPDEIVRRGADATEVLRAFGVSQRHGPDSFAWRRIAWSLSQPDVSPGIRSAVFDGHGDARELLRELESKRGAHPLFPYLKGPKVGTMWVRLLVVPGGARISSIDVLPVAVDVQVRKVTEYLGLTETRGVELERVRDTIQKAWRADVRRDGAEGPAGLENTCAALDPALWFYAKWGCTFCERAGRRLPISDLCRECKFDALSQIPLARARAS